MGSAEVYSWVEVSDAKKYWLKD